MIVQGFDVKTGKSIVAELRDEYVVINGHNTGKEPGLIQFYNVTAKAWGCELEAHHCWLTPFDSQIELKPWHRSVVHVPAGRQDVPVAPEAT